MLLDSLPGLFAGTSPSDCICADRRARSRGEEERQAVVRETTQQMKSAAVLSKRTFRHRNETEERSLRDSICSSILFEYSRLLSHKETRNRGERRRKEKRKRTKKS